MCLHYLVCMSFKACISPFSDLFAYAPILQVAGNERSAKESLPAHEAAPCRLFWVLGGTVTSNGLMGYRA